jgi:hypothetical protein
MNFSPGYVCIRLEATTIMNNAIAMHSSLVFKACRPYYAKPENLAGES